MDRPRILLLAMALALPGCLVEPDADTPPTVAAPTAPTPGMTSTCAQRLATEPHRTFGSDATIPGRVEWAVVRDGSRLVVAWNSTDTFVGILDLEVNGYLLEPLVEDGARRFHLFQVTGLPVGGLACFTLRDGLRTVATHAVRLENGPSHRSAGVYHLNLLAADMQGAGELADAALQGLATALWDATDGHIRIGTVLLLPPGTAYGNGGYGACYEQRRSREPGCDDGFDILFTRDIPGAPPHDLPRPGEQQQAAVGTVIDGFANPRASIWADLETLAQRDPELADGSAGDLLMRQLGHYLFGMVELTSRLRPCSDSQTGISIMGGDIDFVETEFDDPANPCPGAEGIDGYVPSWTRLRERFPQVPERKGAPDPGPEGDGGALRVVRIR